MNPCEGVSDLIGAYLYGDLGQHEVAAVEAHLQACRRCRDDVAQRRRALATLAGQTPTAAERRRITQAVWCGAARADHAAPAATWWIRRVVGARHALPVLAMVGASAVAAGLLFGGVWWGEQRASLQVAPRVVARVAPARPRTAAPAAASPQEKAPGAAAQVSKPRYAQVRGQVRRHAPRLLAAPEPVMQAARVVAPVPYGVDDVRMAVVEE